MNDKDKDRYQKKTERIYYNEEHKGDRLVYKEAYDITRVENERQKLEKR